MSIVRVILAAFLGLGFLLAGARGEAPENAEPCPCTATDPVELIVPELVAQTEGGETAEGASAQTKPQKTQTSGKAAPRATVLILGDSLGLCGFGKTLDTRLRNNPGVGAVYTYLACGTVPISWLKTGPLAKAHTACGYWSIEGKCGEPPAEFRDTYGMQHARRPETHPVPKLEILLEEHKPDILVIQNGTNLLSLFSDGSTILPTRHDSQIRTYLNPLMVFLAQKAPTVKKVYWVAPPVSGRVTTEIQDFLLQRIASYDCAFLNVIDSRTLIKHPYRNTMTDKEHFIGRDMETWAEGILERINRDLSSGLLKAAPASRQKLMPASSKTTAGSPAPARPRVTLKARLLAKSTPLATDKIIPYQESMTAFLYRVEEVLSGEYAEPEIVVMHPAHIRLKPQQLETYKIGSSYKLDLLDFEGSPWESIKRSEETGRIELRPFIRREDEARFPSAPK
jgi:hypothetical protein